MLALRGKKNPNGQITTPLSFDIQQTFIEYLLFVGTGVRKMSNTASVASGNAHSGRERQTHKQAGSNKSLR